VRRDVFCVVSKLLTYVTTNELRFECKLLQIPFNRRERVSVRNFIRTREHHTDTRKQLNATTITAQVLSEMRILQEPALLYNTPLPTSNRCMKQARGRNGNVNTAKWNADLEHRNSIQLDEFRNLNWGFVLKLPSPSPSST
jgi:hypothetical protein